MIAADEFAGVARIYAMALELIRCSAGRLDPQRLHRFVTAYQSITPLTMGELWAWPSALKLALVEDLRTRGDILSTSRAHRLQADRLVNALDMRDAASHRWPSDLHPAFVIRLLQRSRARENAAPSRHELDAALAAGGHAVEDAVRSEAPPGCRTDLPGRRRWQPAPGLDLRLERVLRNGQRRRTGAAARSRRRISTS